MRSRADLFHVLDVLQMCCLCKRSGAVQVVKEGQSGLFFLRDGRIVHAEAAVTRGTEALFEIASWGDGESAHAASPRSGGQRKKKEIAFEPAPAEPSAPPKKR